MGAGVKPMGRDSALQDPERLDALRATGLLDAPPDESIDRFTRLARRLLGTPFAQLSLIDDRRQVAISAVGPPGAAPGDPPRELDLPVRRRDGRGADVGRSA
jgi:hypothetical protein